MSLSRLGGPQVKQHTLKVKKTDLVPPLFLVPSPQTSLPKSIRQSIQRKVKYHAVWEETGGRMLAYSGWPEKQGAEVTAGAAVEWVLCLSLREHEGH